MSYMNLEGEKVMDYKKFIIYWNQRSFFVSGSKALFKRHRVSWENSLVIPGTSIVSWNMSYNYQANRQFPALPLLRKGHTYYVAAKFETVPANSAYIKLDFKDNLGESIKKIYIKQQLGSFEYPKDAHSYTMELIEAGCRQIEFEQIELSETPIIWGDYEFVELPQNNQDEMTILFVEPYHHSIPDVKSIKLDNLGNTVAITSSLWGAGNYFIAEKIESYLVELRKQYSKMRLISYGPYGNVAVKYYQEFLGCPGYVTDEEVTLEEVLQNSEGLSEREIEHLKQAYQTSKTKIWYQSQGIRPTFVKTLINKIDRLQDFKG